MTEWQKAWLAAAIDGEGTIALNRSTGGIRVSRRGFSWNPQVIICNTHRGFCEFAMSITGLGRIQEVRRKVPYRTLYRWHVRGRSAKPLLLEVYPYLIIKKRHAEDLFEAIGWIEKSNYATARYVDFPLRKLWRNLHKLNARGRKPEYAMLRTEA